MLDQLVASNASFESRSRAWLKEYTGVCVDLMPEPFHFFTARLQDILGSGVIADRNLEGDSPAPNGNRLQVPISNSSHTTSYLNLQLPAASSTYPLPRIACAPRSIGLRGDAPGCPGNGRSVRHTAVIPKVRKTKGPV